MAGPGQQGAVPFLQCPGGIVNSNCLWIQKDSQRHGVTHPGTGHWIYFGSFLEGRRKWVNSIGHGPELTQTNVSDKIRQLTFGDYNAHWGSTQLTSVTS